MELETEIFEIDDDVFALTVECFDQKAIKHFKKQGYEGNGYTWQGLTESIARLELDDKANDLCHTPGADEAMVTSDDEAILQLIETKIKMAFNNTDYMKKVIDNADPMYF